MDSPLMPTLRGMPRDMDDSFADLSLASAQSPMPPPRSAGGSSSSGPASGSTSTHDRSEPAPKMMEKETPRNFKARQSVFPAPGSTSRPLGESTGSLGSSSTSKPPARSQLDEDEDEQEEDEGDVTIHASAEDEPEVADTETEGRARRDERLKDSLYELRGMNDTFEVFLNALESARGHNERLAKRVKETSSLLDKYTALLGQTEHTHKLLSNPNWTGAEDDQRALEAEQAAKEAAEEEERRRAQEVARREEEEREQKEAAAAQAEAVRAAAAQTTRGGGTRGRGAPSGMTRGGATRGRGSGIPPPTARTVSGGRPPPTVRKAPSGLGLAGQYANVKSSGYGPSRKAT